MSEEAKPQEVSSEPEVNSTWGGYFTFTNQLGQDIKTGYAKHWTTDLGEEKIDLAGLPSGQTSVAKAFKTCTSNKDRWTFNVTLKDGTSYEVKEKQCGFETSDSGLTVKLQAIIAGSTKSFYVSMPISDHPYLIIMDTPATEPRGDEAKPVTLPLPHDYTLKDLVPGLLKKGDIHASQSLFLPSSPRVMGSGSSYCEGNSVLGTLGVRVDCIPNDGFYYVATYHNFQPGHTKYEWLFTSGGHETYGTTGHVSPDRRLWQLGPPSALTLPIFDCALIRLDTAMELAIAPGLYMGEHKDPVKVLGANNAHPGMGTVRKFGIASGLTYGMVIDLPTSLDPSYDNYIFFVWGTDEYGNPQPLGNFSQSGDSGAPVVDVNGYVLGLVSQGVRIDRGGGVIGTMSLCHRIGTVEAALGVKVHADDAC